MISHIFEVYPKTFPLQLSLNLYLFTRQIYIFLWRQTYFFNTLIFILLVNKAFQHVTHETCGFTIHIIRILFSYQSHSHDFTLGLQLRKSSLTTAFFLIDRSLLSAALLWFMLLCQVTSTELYHAVRFKLPKKTFHVGPI